MEEKKEYQHSVSNADILLRESEFTDLIDKDNTNNDKTPMNMNLHYIILYPSQNEFNIWFARFTVTAAGISGISPKLNGASIFSIFFNPALFPFFSNS